MAQGSQVSLLDSLVVGTAEHSPVHLVVVRVSGDVSQVRFAASGGSDTAAPVNGLAVLAVPAASTDGTITVPDADGQLRGSIPLPQESTRETPACSPQPLPLPKPGKQPADPATADKAVRAAYTKAFTAVPGDDGYSSLSAVQNGDALHGALDQLGRNFARAAASSSVELGQPVSPIRKPQS